MKVNFKEDFEQGHLKFYVGNHNIGLDLDEVLCNFVGRFKEYYPHIKHTDNWYFTYGMNYYMDKLNEDKEFWAGITPLISPEEIPFIPKCYVSKRTFPVDWTEEWIEKNKFPCVPVIHVNDSKVEACKSMKLDFFIDDSIKNFQELNANSIKTFLMSAKHNLQYNVGNYRLNHLKEVVDKI